MRRIIRRILLFPFTWWLYLRMRGLKITEILIFAAFFITIGIIIGVGI